jgi:guanine nucleotide-binding protein G(I)/G(S)/G(T) subunit beta-1
MSPSFSIFPLADIGSEQLADNTHTHTHTHTHAPDSSPCNTVRQHECDFPTIKNTRLEQRRMLKGHLGKVYACNWHCDSRHLVSAAQDSKLIVWNAFAASKFNVIPLRSSWVMSCAFAPMGNFVASCGLENTASIFRLTIQRHEASPDSRLAVREFVHPSGTEGFMSSLRFLDDTILATAHSDGTALLWDMETRAPLVVLAGHNGEVHAIASAVSSSTVTPLVSLATASADGTVKLWDVRTNRCARTFEHHVDVNAVHFLPNNHTIITGADDGVCRLFDVRANKLFNEYAPEHASTRSAVTSVSSSSTGRILFAGYDDYACRVWDAVSGSELQSLYGHDRRVSCLDVAPDSQVIVSGSWDGMLRVWA